MKLPGYIAGPLAAVDVKLVVNALDLGLDGVDRDDQFVGDLWVRAACRQQAQDTSLLTTQWLNQPRFATFWYKNTLLFAFALVRTTGEVGQQVLCIDK